MPDIAGLKLIVPTSVAGTGVSVSATGKVTFTSSATININGCFTSSYDNYLIVIRHTNSGNANFFWRMRLSGTDASGASTYVSQQLSAGSTTVSGQRLTDNKGYVGLTASGKYSGDHIFVYGPNLAQPTALRTVTVDDYSLGLYIDDFACTHSVSTAYDGITIYPDSGSMTGALTIYGLAN